MPCPFCQEKLSSGIGFRVGAIASKTYKLGDKLDWKGKDCRPEKRPKGGNISTVGYFNCDNIRCSTWSDCYPEVQQAIITIRGTSLPKPRPLHLETISATK